MTKASDHIFSGLAWEPGGSSAMGSLALPDGCIDPLDPHHLGERVSYIIVSEVDFLDTTVLCYMSILLNVLALSVRIPCPWHA